VASAATALRFHAITLAEAPHDGLAGDGASPNPLPRTTLIPFRDLCAVVSEQKVFARDAITDEAIAAHRAIVDGVFRHAAVLPAPVGVVFRAPAVLTRWMELHYVSLTSALEFVDDRAVARVHIARADNKDELLEEGSELSAAAAESFRALRRLAVAAVPIHPDKMAKASLSAAFLVEREAWKEFERGVKDQSDAHHLLSFEITGPWAPYDFVRMQFGG
jgi:hypothetical protein